MNLPIEFEEKMQDLLGGEYNDYLKCYEEPRHYGLRVNTSKISIDRFLEIAPWPLRPIPWIENGFYYDGEKYQPAKHPYYFAGLYYLQEPSAMTPANRLPIEAGDRVLDVCAAPGGKATELGAKLNGSGVLIANDLSNSRARGLLKNIELFGIGNVLVLSEEPGKLVNYFPEYFDKILIDAPCSGEGMFRKDRKMVKAWEEHGPEFFVKIQRSIITQAAQMLKPGGMLLYSTCTFSPEENEQTIEFLLQEYPQFKICDIKGYEGFSDGILKASLSGNEQLKKTIRIFPHKMEGEGHFIALLKKEEEAVSENLKEKEKNNRNKNEKEKRLPDELTEFLKNVKRKFDSSRIDMRGENVYYMPEGLPKLNGVRFLRSGLLLGELKKRRFEPSQALAMNLKKEEYENVLDFSVDGAKLNGSGVLIANDLSNSRARGLLKNIELFGIGNVLVLSEEPGKLVNYFPEYFDKILIDAPCSGEGMFRKDRKMVKAWEEHGPEFFVKIQRSIITQAAQMLKPGGMLLYSTCTFSPEENEQTIEFLLQEYPQFKICDIKGYEGFSDGILKASLSGNEQLKKTIRIFPHKMEGEGHFIALLKKEEEAVSENLKEKEKNNRNKNEKEKRLPDELTEFLKNVKRKFDSSRIDMRGENVYYMPEGLPKLNGVRFLRSGLLLGELKKRRFEPSQALAMNLKKEEYENVLDFSVDDERIIKYLKGETLEVEDLVSSKEKGWYLVCVDGYPLGFGKLSGQMLKNKYLPGWRWQSS